MEPRILFAEVRRVKQYSGDIFATGLFVLSFVSNKPRMPLKYPVVLPACSPVQSRDRPAKGALDSDLSCLF